MLRAEEAAAAAARVMADSEEASVSESASRGGGAERLSSLPLSRVKLIMKSSPDVSSISPEALFLTAKSTELFVELLAREALGVAEQAGELEYADLARGVRLSETLHFLSDILPEKITGREYLALLDSQRKVAEEKEERDA
ncbi:chromatin accessibility complex protein 1 [Lampetra fluviatilis]